VRFYIEGSLYANIFPRLWEMATMAGMVLLSMNTSKQV